MARSGSDISTRIGFSGSEDVKKQLESLARAGEKAMSDLQKGFANTKNPFSGLSEGADEVKRHFDNLALSSQRAGNTVRASLLSATGGTTSFVAGAHAATASSKQVSFALRDLSFQANDVATSLASGISPMRTFAQQGGQIFQAFQIAGGPGAVFGALGTSIKNIISPTLIAATAIGVLALGFGILVARASSSDQSAKSFDIQLKAIGKSSLATGKDLEEGAKSLRDVGLSADEARDHLHKALNEGVKPQDAVKITRIGANVAAALGEGKDGIDRFTAAVGKGGPALREYAEKLGIVPKYAKEVEAELKAAADAIDETNKRNREFNDILFKRNQAIADDTRRSGEQELDSKRKLNQDIKDLTRTRGTDEQELRLSFRRREEEEEIQKNRRIADINRQTNREIADMLLKRNRDAAQKMKEFNDKIAQDAQDAAASSPGVLAQIDERTKNAAREQLSPIGRALQDLGTAWSSLLDTMSKSDIIQGAVSALTGLVNLLTTGFKNDTVTTIAAVVTAIAGIGVAVGLVVPFFSLMVGGITSIIGAFTGLVTGASAVASGLLAIVAFVGWPAILLAGVIALVASFVNWSDVLSGKTWSDFLGTLGAFFRMLGAIAGYLSDQFMQVWNSVWDGIKSGFNAVVQFFSDQIAIIKGFFVSLGSGIADTFSKAVSIVKSAAAFFGLANGGLVPGFAFGGPISGPSGTDRVPIWATAGEYMVKKPSVDYLGVGFMHMVNRFPERVASMLSGQHFASGGLIDWQPPTFPDRLVSGGLVDADLSGGGEHDRVSIDLKMPDGEVFGDMLTPRTVAAKFGRYARQRNRLAIGRRPEWQT